MRVLVQGYNTCCQNESGGVQIRIRNYVQALLDNGCEVDLFQPFKTNLRDYEILHVFKLDIENLALIRSAKAMGKKVVLSTIVNCVNGRKIDLYRWCKNLPIATTYKFLFEIIFLSDLIIVESEQERQFMVQHYGATKDKVYIIANGAKDLSTGDQSIYQRIGSVQDYVLQVGRFDENKNQLNVIRALKDTDIPVIFVGGADISGNYYYELCCNEAKNCRNIHFLGWIQNESMLLKSAYANAKVLIVPSYTETFGLTIIEGAIAGANLVISDTLPILSDAHFNGCITCKPDDINSILKGIQKAMRMDSNKNFQNKIKKDFSWENIAKKHIKMYCELLD